MTKKLLLSLFVVFSTAGLVHAQKTPMVLTVNIGELYQNFWKAQEADEKFQSTVDNAQQEIQGMYEEGLTLASDLQDLREKIKNPALTEDARARFITDAQELERLIRTKEAEVNSYRMQTERMLQQRRQSIIELHISEIREVIVEVAKARGADLVLNSAGMSVVYFDESYDVTQEVLAKLNADKPTN